MSEREVYLSAEQRFITKCFIKENLHLSGIGERLKRQFGEETLTDERNTSFKYGRERVENYPHSRRPKTSKTKEIK